MIIRKKTAKGGQLIFCNYICQYTIKKTLTKIYKKLTGYLVSSRTLVPDIQLPDIRSKNAFVPPTYFQE